MLTGMMPRAILALCPRTSQAMKASQQQSKARANQCHHTALQSHKVVAQTPCTHLITKSQFQEWVSKAPPVLG